MAQTTNKFQIIQKVSAEDTILIHPETEAEVVKYKGTTSGIVAENVQGAIDKIYEQVKNIESGGIVTGLKGDKDKKIVSRSSPIIGRNDLQATSP